MTSDAVRDGLKTGHDHPVDPDRRGIDAIAADQVVRRRYAWEHVLQVAGDRHLADGVGELALFDPEARSAAAVIAGHAVEAHAHHLGDIETGLDLTDQLFRRQFARHQRQIAGRGRGRAAGAARSMAGGDEAELPGRTQVQEPGGEAAVLDDRPPAGRDALTIERAGAYTPHQERVVDDLDAGCEELRPHLVAQERGAARHGRARDRTGQAADEAVRHARIEHDRQGRRGTLARVEAPHRAFAGRAADLRAALEVAGMDG